MAKSLQGRKAIVTGASRGIGEGIALELARRGADVLITYSTSKDKAKVVEQKLKDLGSDAFAIEADAFDRSAPAKIIDAAVDRYGHVDILINNVGFGYDVLLEDLTYDQWDKTIQGNLAFPVFLVQQAMKHFGEAPRIVNIGSVAARGTTAMYLSYASAKAGLEGATRIMARELGQRFNATVNCVEPGPVATDGWFNGEPSTLEKAQERIRTTPAAARLGTVDDVAQIVAFLSEEGSRWCSASVVNANGGMFPI